MVYYSETFNLSSHLILFSLTYFSNNENIMSQSLKYDQ